MKQYLIAGIRLDFAYEYDDFFKNNIEKYEVFNQKSAKYQLLVKTVNNLEEPQGKRIAKYKNRSVFEDDTFKYIVAYHENDKVKMMIKHTKDYQIYEIYLTKIYGDRLAEMEYVFSGLAFMEVAINEQRFSLHASAIEINNRAMVFSATSGGGKSTHVKNWEKLGINFKIINDDKPLIYKKDGLYVVAGTPWSGKEMLNNNLEVPLYAIVFLEQGKSNKITDLNEKEKVVELLKNTHRPDETALYSDTLKIIEDLVKSAMILKFTATKDSSSALFLHDILF